MIKLVTVIGARPQIIKAAAISRAIRMWFSHDIEEIILHTGQHYDNNMSKIFFDELEVAYPDYNLGVGSGSHSEQLAKMVTGIEQALIEQNPDAIILYGDTNSTLAGSVAASKLHVPVIHIEAGLRSFNKNMPEEINRIICDHCSTMMFTPTLTGYNNLINEGFKVNTAPPFNINNPKIWHCGDIMYDNALYYSAIAEKRSSILSKHNLENNNYFLATIHRDHTTDHPETLGNLFNTLKKISIESGIPFVIPLHPRTRKNLDLIQKESMSSEFTDHLGIKLIDPVGYLDMLLLEKNAKMIFTDSGGVQKESYFFKKPCIILRKETEWKELVTLGTARITGTDQQEIFAAYEHFKIKLPATLPPIFGDGNAASFICKRIIEVLG